MRSTLHALTLATGLLLVSTGPLVGQVNGDDGVLPRANDGHALNLDFETGDFRDWTAKGNAFAGQPIEGDAVVRRRGDMRSRHQGRYWIGSYERNGDEPKGTLTSSSFVLDKPYARFLLAGGGHENTRVEIVRQDSGQTVFRGSGTNTEELIPVVVDLTAHLGKELFVRIVDEESGGWGHVNFDDFKLWATKPPEPIRASAPRPDAFLHAGLSPEAAARAMDVPTGFKVTLFAGEPDVVQPIAFAIDDRGRLWVAEAYAYPVRVPDDKARDRVLIFEDVDGNGKFDKRKVFADKLNLVSGIEIGFGGVWIGAAPNLLFIPDKNGDDKPDGPAEVVLDGWAYQDTHETLNSFAWGPDGWLYGCHGVFTHSRVGKPGCDERDRTPINAGIWRFHPSKRVFEIFAEGTSNPWGVDFDANGEAFLTACVIPHLYHVFPGGRYERQAGRHFERNTYDDIKTIADHRHYLGANPHSGNGRSDEAGGGHAHAGAMIYQGAAWPKEYAGSIFMNNIHGARLNRDLLVPSGSGYVGKHAPDFLFANDQWSQIVSLKSGPDGQMYMIDWYDKNQCHHGDVNGHDRTNGRIFKVSYEKSSGSVHGIEPKSSTALDLVRMLDSENDWYARHASRMLFEKFAKNDETYQQSKVAASDALTKLAFKNPTVRVRLAAMRLLAAMPADSNFTGWNEPDRARALDDDDPHVRAFAVRELMRKRRPDEKSTLLKLAKSDSSPVVRLAIASNLSELELADRWEIVEALAAHGEDAKDHNIPLMIWYAADGLERLDPARAMKLGLKARVPHLLAFMTRSVASIQGPNKALPLLIESLDATENDSDRLTILQEINRSNNPALAGPIPSAWPKVYKKLADSREDRVRTEADALALRFGDPRALETLRVVLADPARDLQTRRQALEALLRFRDPNLPPLLRILLGEPGIRVNAIQGLSLFNDPLTPVLLLKVYPTLDPSERRAALTTLAVRAESTKMLLEAVGAGKIASKEVSADVVRLMRNHKNEEINRLIANVWGKARESTAEREKALAKYSEIIYRKGGPRPNLALGRALYAKSCQECHTLFGVGGKIGPDLTGSNRGDVAYILSNVIDPSALIGKDYLAHVISTTDGRVLTGMIKAEDDDALTLQTANEQIVILNQEIDARKPSDQSMMPEGQWEKLSDEEVRSFVAYLQSSAQTPMLATAENVALFFDGRDLAGWQGDPKLWTVENGEIVGKTSGLKQNAFLRSEMSAGDFRLTLKIKLVGNQGNSGIQFRSEARVDGEMEGYQADAGAGWWGRLYEENGRGLIWPKSGEEFLKAGEWNVYEIVAEGSRIRTSLNGKLCVDLDDPKGAIGGIFAFQLHSGGPTEVRFKDVKLELIPKRN